MSETLTALTRALHEEKPDIESLIQMVEGKEEALKLIVDGLTFSVDTYRYNCNTIILKVAEKAPKMVFPYWDYLAGLLDSSNTYHRCSAINILPHLIPVDGGSKFEQLFDRFFGCLDDDSVIPPCYVARNCSTIVSYLPGYGQRIVGRLLGIDETRHKSGRKDLIKADIILALDHLYNRVDNRTEVLRFVKDQLQSSSPKTRKAAEAFLIKYGDG